MVQPTYGKFYLHPFPAPGAPIWPWAAAHPELEYRCRGGCYGTGRRLQPVGRRGRVQFALVRCRERGCPAKKGDLRT